MTEILASDTTDAEGRFRLMGGSLETGEVRVAGRAGEHFPVRAGAWNAIVVDPSEAPPSGR